MLLNSIEDGNGFPKGCGLIFGGLAGEALSARVTEMYTPMSRDIE